jgi:hypothetical protein
MENAGYTIIPPILSVKVQDNVDVMITRDTARRASSLLGFPPASQAKLASAAAVLAELVLHTRMLHELNFNGVMQGGRIGVQVSSVVPWLANVPANRVELALQVKIGSLVDEIAFMQDETSIIALILWQPQKKDAIDQK